MVDRELILAKAAAGKKHLRRVDAKRGSSMAAFTKDVDRQDIVMFNLQMAIQPSLKFSSAISSNKGSKC